MNTSCRILVVDDEASNRKLLLAMLRSLGYEAEAAVDGFDALTKLNRGFDAALVDVMMPGMDGFEVTRRIREDPCHGDTLVIMVTALNGKDDQLRAVEVGCNGFISKPVDLTELKIRMNALFKFKKSQDRIKRDRDNLKAGLHESKEVLKQVREDLVQAERHADRAYEDTVNRLAVAAEFRDDQTGLHTQRVGAYCAVLAGALGLSAKEAQMIRAASPMHDVGKIGIPDSILLKAGKLDGAEWEIMKTHTFIGARVLGGSDSPLLQTAEIIALSHHEKWDGTGYPGSLKGEAIPLCGRICAVADVFDALTAHRPYRRAISTDRALDRILKGRAKHFDPMIVDLFAANFDLVLTARAEWSEN